MSRRYGFFRWTASLAAALLPGCAHTFWPGPSASTGTEAPSRFGPSPTARAEGRPISPYHPEPPDAVAGRNQKYAMRTEPPEQTPGTLRPVGPADNEMAGTARPTAPPLPETTRRSDEPLLISLRAYLDKRPEEALEALRSYDKSNQDMLLAVLPFLARLSEGSLATLKPEEAAHHIGQFRALEASLAARAPLKIEQMQFCKRATGFGEYIPLEEGHEFQAGAGDCDGETVKVYVELANLSQRRNGLGYETWAAARVEILDFKGVVVAEKVYMPEGDLSRSPKHDYYYTLRFAIPSKVPPGRYTLRLEVKDVTGLPGMGTQGLTPQSLDVPRGRVDMRCRDITVVAPRARRGETEASVPRLIGDALPIPR